MPGLCRGCAWAGLLCFFAKSLPVDHQRTPYVILTKQRSIELVVRRSRNSGFSIGIRSFSFGILIVARALALFIFEMLVLARTIARSATKLVILVRAFALFALKY